MRYAYGNKMWTRSLTVWSHAQYATVSYVSRPMPCQTWSARHVITGFIVHACLNGSIRQGKISALFASNPGAGQRCEMTYTLGV